MNDSSNWFKEWDTLKYQQAKKENFTALVNYIKTPIKNVLDIGCGLAWESRMLNERFGTELFLLDGDSSNNLKGSNQIGYNNSADFMSFYHSLEDLDLKLQQLGTKNYHLINCNNINLPADLKFDLVTSWVSCGFHYPSSTYRDLILKHSHNNTKIIFDLRLKTKLKEPILESGIEIVNLLKYPIIKGSKYVMAELKFV
jgi:SAM-dependent methyltransferase